MGHALLVVALPEASHRISPSEPNYRTNGLLNSVELSIGYADSIDLALKKAEQLIESTASSGTTSRGPADRQTCLCAAHRVDQWNEQRFEALGGHESLCDHE
jgi:hypothetical protein